MVIVRSRGLSRLSSKGDLGLWWLIMEQTGSRTKLGVSWLGEGRVSEERKERKGER